MNRAFRTLPVLCVLALVACNQSSDPATSQGQVEPKDPVAPGYASRAGQLLAEFRNPKVPQSPESMAQAAQTFLSSLRPEVQSIVLRELQDPERRTWTNSPADDQPGGLALGTLRDDQLVAAYAMFAAVLSETGFNKYREVMLGDDLRAVIDGVPNRGVGIEDFRVVLFGNPAPGSSWGLQLDGHHVALNVTIRGDGGYSMSPSFIGTYPARFEVGGKIYTPLDGEVDLAYALLNSLSPEQRQLAVVSPERQGLRVGAGQDGIIPEQTGVDGRALDVAQKTLMLSLADRWISMMPQAQAQATRAKLEAQIDDTTFSWHGSTEPGQDISYIVQSPTLIFEMGHDQRGGAAGASPVDHIHTIFRDLEREYGGI